MIIGSGAGGGFAALNLAASGQKVLLVERGPDPYDPRPDSSGRPFKHVIDQERYLHNGSPRKLFMGHGVGGSTSIYGAVLLRPRREDFEPGRHLGRWLESEDGEWPVTYDEMLPYFERVEDHFGMAPFNPGDVGSGGLESLAPVNRRLVQRWRDQGYNPGILPLAINRSTCIRCADCPGYVCPTEARGSTRQAIIQQSRTMDNFSLWTGCEVQSIDRHRPVITVKKAGQKDLVEVRADRVILSAGAINSAALLLRSGFGDDYPMLGRCFMYHAGAVVFGLFRQRTNGGHSFIKQLGLEEFYFGTRDFPHKLGIVQSLPTPRAATTAIRNHLYLMMATVEDLPRPENRVEIGRDGRKKVFHQFHSYDMERSFHCKKILTRLMRDAGAIRAFAASARMNKTHVGHQVGTARFGTSPRTSVLDRWCRPHGMEHLHVLDGSFLPTSMGASPALTIMANALRVTDHIIQN